MVRKYTLSKESKAMLAKHTTEDLREIKKVVVQTEDIQKLQDLIRKDDPNDSVKIEELRRKVELNVDKELGKMKPKTTVKNIKVVSIDKPIKKQTNDIPTLVKQMKGESKSIIIKKIMRVTGKSYTWSARQYKQVE